MIDDTSRPHAPAPAPVGWVERGGLTALYTFTVAAVVGYGVYGLHPERLPRSELALAIFNGSFEMFARLHIVIAFAVLAVALVRALGIRWVAPFLAVCVAAFTAEHLGTGYGVPFGGYAYTGLLGVTLGGRVPALIPVSWFLMALPSWLLARRAGAGRLATVSLGALWLVAWDLALDPAMSALTPYWVWQETGPYYGMPWLNLVGWYVTGLVLMAILSGFADRAGWERLDVRWMTGYYAAILLMPLGMLAAAGAWLAVATTAAGLAACWGVTVAVAGRNTVAARLSPAPAGAVEA